MPPWSELGPDELTALPSLMRMDYSLDSCPSTAALFLRRSSTTGPRAHPERLQGGTLEALRMRPWTGGRTAPKEQCRCTWTAVQTIVHTHERGQCDEFVGPELGPGGHAGLFGRVPCRLPLRGPLS